MAYPGKHRKPAPRGANLVKAALRQGSGPAPAIAAPARVARPRVDFADPLMRHAALQAKGIGLCSFLVTLAAFQRGLQVSFHYERASFDARFANAKLQGHRGELFSIGNGTRTHVFSRTLGDRTAAAANAIAEDKHLTKRALAQAGVRTPEGIVAERGQATLIEKFVARDPTRRFVVKPLAGSLARGVHADVAAGAVPGIVRQMSVSRVLVEEYVAGVECRATVVDGRCVAVSRRAAPTVTGDGTASIEALVARRSAALAGNPFFGPIECTDEVKAYLARQGLVPASVPPAGRDVQLLNTSYGVGHEDVTGSIGEAVMRQAVKAAHALGLPVCGIDLIVDAAGEVCVLELNQRPYIGMHSFPSLGGGGQGNAVAEAIVDFYFPETVGHCVQPALAYDFAAVRAVLGSGQVSMVTLPAVGADWRVIRLTESGVAARTMAELVRTAAKAAGVHVMAAQAEKGVALCLAAAPVNLRLFLSMMPAQYRSRFAAPDGGPLPG